MTICAAKTISILIDHRNIIEKTHLTLVKVGVEHSFPIFPESLTNLTTWSDFTNSSTLISIQKEGGGGGVHRNSPIQTSTFT